MRFLTLCRSRQLTVYRLEVFSLVITDLRISASSCVMNIIYMQCARELKAIDVNFAVPTAKRNDNNEKRRSFAVQLANRRFVHVHRRDYRIISAPDGTQSHRNKDIDPRIP